MSLISIWNLIGMIFKRTFGCEPHTTSILRSWYLK